MCQFFRFDLAGEMRKDKSLGIMSQKFLMLFLVSKVRTVIFKLLLLGDAGRSFIDLGQVKKLVKYYYLTQ